MNKQSGFIATVVIFIIALIGFYIYLKKQQKPGLQPLSAIPQNCALIIDIKKPLKSWNKVDKNNNFFRKLKSFNSINTLSEKVERFDSVINSIPKFQDLIQKKGLMISVHEVGNKQFYSLFIFPLGGRFEANQVIKHIQNKIGQDNITTTRYNQVRIYHAKKDTKEFFYCYHNGLLMGSKSEILLQDAIRQSESSTNLIDNNELTRLMETSGEHTVGNIYVQFKYFKPFLEKVMAERFFKNKSINHLGEWMELDINLKDETLLLNGFAFAADKSSKFLSVFSGQTPQTMKVLKLVPVGAESFVGFGLSDFKLFRQNLEIYMDEIGQPDRYSINKKALQKSLGKSCENEFKSIFSNELMQVSLPDMSKLFYIRTSGYRDANDMINKWINHYSKISGTSAKQMKKEYKIDAGSSFSIYKMPIDYFPVRMFGPWFKSCKATYVTVFDDYIIFGDSYKALSKTIYDNVLQKSIAYDASFSKFSDYLSSRINFFGYVSLTGTGNNLKNILNNEAFSFYKKNQSMFRDYYGIAWQFAVDNGMFYNNLLFRHQPGNAIRAVTEWETRLDTAITFKPQLVTNHYTREKEIFVQDARNNIYLINRSGRILWKKPIEKPIMGRVYQVDYFKNGKLQILFNTETKLYLLDRNGNFVEHYPVLLPDKAVTVLSLFDYEKNRNYRIFIPLQNKKVVVYNIKGNTVTGFRFSGTDHKIISPVQYFRDNNKDYIIVTDRSRVYILDRRGNSRVKVEQQFMPSENNIFAFQKGSNTRHSRLVRTDTEGKVYYIYLDGKVETKNICKCSKKHYFAVADVTGDRINDFIYVDNNELTVYSLTGKKEFVHKFDNKITLAPSFYKFGANKTYTGVTDKSAQQIFLFDTKGNVVKGFPLTGKTRFSIGLLEPGSGLFNLVVGGNEYYLYNYKLN